MPKVTFINEKKVVEAEPGAYLRDVALAHGIQVHHEHAPLGSDLTMKLAQYAHCSHLRDFARWAAKNTCGCDPGIAKFLGGGICGTCHVYVKKGMENCSPKTLREKLRLAAGLFSIGHEDEVRLSCQARVMGDIEVETRPEPNLFGEKFW